MVFYHPTWHSFHVIHFTFICTSLCNLCSNKWNHVVANMYEMCGCTYVKYLSRNNRNECVNITFTSIYLCLRDRALASCIMDLYLFSQFFLSPSLWKWCVTKNGKTKKELQMCDFFSMYPSSLSYQCLVSCQSNQPTTTHWERIHSRIKNWLHIRKSSA